VFNILMMLALSCIPVSQAGADSASDLDDAVARVQYAFYTLDARALQEALTLIAPMQSSELPPGMSEYYAAYGNWKLAQIYSERPPTQSQSGKAAQECARHARAARTQDARMAEAYAIEAVCSGLGATLFSGNCAQKPLRTAQELDPRNPRIKLIELQCLQKEEGSSPAYAQKLGDLVDAFESAPPAGPGKPDWGQAEALVMLGRSHLQRGDSLAARDAIERALVIAPDYRQAQELLQTAATRPK